MGRILDRRLAAITFAISIGVALLTSFVLFLFFERHQRAELGRELERLSRSLREPISQAAWVMEYEQINAIFQGLQSNPRIHSARFQGSDGGVVQFEKPNCSIAIPRTFSVYREHGKQGMPLGTVDLVGCVDAERASLMRALALFSLKEFILCAALALLILWQVRRLITNRLTRIAGALVTRDSPDALCRQISISPGDDEINRLVEAINLRSRLLENKLEELNSNQKYLIQAREAAEEASRARTLLVAQASHELRTPLTGVVGAAELLEAHADRPPNPSVLKALMESASHLLRLVNRILDDAALETRKVELKVESVDFREVMERLEREFRILAERKRLTLLVEPPSDASSVLRTDPLRLEQVLANLLDNAIKYTESGKVRVTWQSTPGTHAGGKGWFSFSVEDSGIGIAPQDHERIFDPFVEAQKSSRRSTKSSGLGLSICRRLVELMNGTIQVDSSLGQGSRFTVTLPQ